MSYFCFYMRLISERVLGNGFKRMGFRGFSKGSICNNYISILNIFNNEILRSRIFMENSRPNMEQLIYEYSQTLMRLCYLYLKDYHMAEDAVQETLYKAYKNYGTFNHNSSLKTWITKIAVNVCKDCMRKPGYKEIATDASIMFAVDKDANIEVNMGENMDANIEENMEVNIEENYLIHTNDESSGLLNAVYNLSGKYKQVILMRYYMELSINEIASICNEKPNTVSVRLKRAKEMLKESIKEGC